MPLTREQMAKRAAQELRNGYYVNLGVGLPTLVSNYIPPNMQVFFHSENGMLGFGPYPWEGEEDPDLINAGKQTITELAGCSYFSSADSFSMIRSGAIDISMLGAFQVSATGDLANWMVPGLRVKGMGGAMDLVSGAKKTIIMMEHLSKNGDKKILNTCSMPLTGVGVVNLIVTDMAVLEVSDKGLVLKEFAPDLTPAQVQDHTEPRFSLDPHLQEIPIAA